MSSRGHKESTCTPMYTGFKHEAIVRGIKILDIAYISIVYITMAFLISYVLDTYVLPPVDPEEENKKPIWRLILEVAAMVGFIGVLSYICRNLIQLVPFFWFEGVECFEHLRVNEVRTASLLSVFSILFCTNLQTRIAILKKKLS